MARRLNPHPDDAVSALLAAVKVHSAIYCLSDLSAPWGFQVNDSSVAKFHLVLEGACVLTLDSGEHVPMECGELVPLPSDSARGCSAVALSSPTRCPAHCLPCFPAC